MNYWHHVRYALTGAPVKKIEESNFLVAWSVEVTFPESGIKKQLEMQIKYLRTRLSNNKVKYEIEVEALNETIHTLQDELTQKDSIIKILQKYITEREERIEKLQTVNEALKKEDAVNKAIIEELKLHISKLLGQIKKDSSSSGKPPSTGYSANQSHKVCVRRVAENQEDNQVILDIVQLPFLILI